MKIRPTLATAGALVLALTACSSGTPAPANAPTSAAGTQASGPVTISYLHRLPDGENMTKVNDIVARWNKENPDIKVEATKFDGKAAEMIKKIQTDAAAGSKLCLAQVGYAEVPALYTQGLLADVSSQAKEYSKNFSDGPASLMTVGGVTVGLPQDTGPLVYYYNQAEFEKLGIKAPTTMEELRTAARTAAEQGKYIVDFQTDEAQYGLSALASSAGATWYEAGQDAWTVNVTSPETAKVTELWQGLLDDKAALTEQRWGDGFKKALVEQKLIGTIGAAWEAPLLADDMADTPNVGQWRVAALPTFDGTERTGSDGGSGVAVLMGCEHPDQAMKFNDWFNTQIDDLASQGLVVAAKGSVKTPATLSEFYGGQDVMSVLAKANEQMNGDFAYIPTWPAVGDPMSKAAAAAADGSGKVEDIFTAAQGSSLSSLKDAGLPVK